MGEWPHRRQCATAVHHRDEGLLTSVNDATPPDDAPDPDGSPDGATPSAGGAGGTRSRRRTVAKVVIGTVVALALVTGVTVVLLYRQLNENLTGVDVEGMLSDRPDTVEVEGPKEPLNVLVMGYDTREGEGNDIDGEEGEGGSDTTILFHFSADRERAYGVSIPRDSMVDRPECTAEDGSEIPAEDYVQWNEAFTLGGQACTIQQFEQLTDLRIDHYVVLDFAGFKSMVNAIDGVEVCIPETIDDPKHQIYLEAGTRELEGDKALDYVRQRYAVGDGSDIGRMKRQQAFIASMAAKVLSKGTLSRPDKVYGFLSAATKSLTVDPELDNIRTLAGLGLEFQGIGLDNIQFLTVPFEYDPQNPNRVIWAPEAKRVWRKLRNDETLGPRLTEGAISAADTPSGPDDPAASPSGDDPPSATASPTPDDEASAEQEAAAEAAGLCV